MGTMVAAGGVLASFPWLEALSEESRKATAGNKARIAVVGTGSRGQLLLRWMVQNPKIEVKYVCDTYPANLDKGLAIVPTAKTQTDYRRVLEDPEVDGVFVVTPPYNHLMIARDAMQAGKAVYCEKSLAFDCDDSLEMYNTHLRTGAIFFVGQQRMYDPMYLRGVEMINRGEFGKIQSIRTMWDRNTDWRRPVPSPELERLINWRMYKDLSNGMSTEFACHQIQLGTWIYRDLPERIYGTGGRTFWDDGRTVDDNISILYTYRTGERMSFDGVSVNKHYGCEEQVLGSKGTFEFEKGLMFRNDTPPMPGFLNMLNDAETHMFNNLNIGGPSWDPEVAKNEKGAYITGSKRTYLDGTPWAVGAFAEAIITGEQPPMIAQEGYYATILSLLGYQSIEERREIIFPEKYVIDYPYLTNLKKA